MTKEEREEIEEAHSKKIRELVEKWEVWRLHNPTQGMARQIEPVSVRACSD